MGRDQTKLSVASFTHLNEAGTRRADQFYQFARPTPEEGRIAIVTNAGWDAVDAAASGASEIAGRDQLRERSDGVQTNGAASYGEVVWS